MGDAAKGEKVFAKCKACHVADAETNHVGPHLKGVIGRNVASVASYKYSEAMLDFAKTNPVWTDELFLKYIENPKAHGAEDQDGLPGPQEGRGPRRPPRLSQDQDVTRCEDPCGRVARDWQNPRRSRRPPLRFHA